MCRRVAFLFRIYTYTATVAPDATWRSTEHSFLHSFLGVYTHKKNELGHEVRCKLVTGRNDSRYEQFETSSETLEQELRPAVFERQTVGFKENYSTDNTLGLV